MHGLQRLLPCFLIAAVALVVAADVAGAPAPAGARSQGTVRVQYKGVALQRVIREIGEATDTRFIFGDEVRGVITISVPKPVSESEALELLRAALFIKGFAQLPAGGDAYKVVPIAATPTESEVVDRPLDLRSEKAITTLVQLEHIAADEIAETIKPLAPSSGAVVAYMPTNSIVLSGTESALGRLLAVIRLLDEAAAEQLWARVIRYRDVDELVEVADAVLNEGWSRANQIEFFSEPRTNMLLARASKERLDELRDFVEEFDRLEAGAGGIHVVRVLNRETNEVLEIIQALQAGRTSTRGRPQDRSRPDQPVGDDRGDAEELDLPTSETAASLEGLQFTLTSDEPSRSIIIQAAQSEAQLVADMISELDRIPPRVAVEVFYFELQRPSGYVLSFDVTATASPSDKSLIRVQSTPAGALSTPTEDTASGAFARVGSARETLIGAIENPITGETIEAIELPTNEAVVNASATGTVAALLSRPTLTVTSGEEHELFIGNNVPIPISSSGGSTTVPGADGETTTTFTNPLIQQQTIEREDVGVLLRIKPTVGEEGSINLDLTFEVTDVVPSIVGVSGRAVGVTLAKRTIESTTVLRPGQYVLLGMAEERAKVNSKVGVPWLMNIPGLGLFFSRIEERVVDTRLMVAARARLLRSPADDVAETVRRRIAFERTMSRVNDLERLPDRPWAVRLATFDHREPAKRVAAAFDEDGYLTRVTKWAGSDRDYWDVYLTGYPDYETASTVAMQATESDWDGEVLLVPAINELAPGD